MSGMCKVRDQPTVLKGVLFNSRSFLVLRIFVLLLGSIWSQSPALGTEAPPTDHRVLSLLKALPPNHGVILGSATVLGEFNQTALNYRLDETGPQRRDYSLKMVWAPERRRALFAGANHGRPHRLNDVWEFDLAAMAWILLYAPDNPRGYRTLGNDYTDVEFREGILITRRGGPAVIGHTWSGLTYDPVRQQMLYMNTWVTDQANAVRELGGNPELLYKGPPLWAFSPSARRWQPLKSEPPGPRAPFGAMLEYVAELDGAIWHMNNWQMRSTWLYQGDLRRWMNLKANFETKDFSAEAPSRELVGYYDPRRKLLVARQGRGTYHFDIPSRVWTKVGESDSTSTPVPEGHDARTVFYFHPSSGHGLLVDFKLKAIWAYDPDSVHWSLQTPRGDPMPDGARMLAYVDLEQNVLVVIDDLRVWAYRYR